MIESSNVPLTFIDLFKFFPVLGERMPKTYTALRMFFAANYVVGCDWVVMGRKENAYRVVSWTRHTFHRTLQVAAHTFSFLFYASPSQ